MALEGVIRLSAHEQLGDLVAPGWIAEVLPHFYLYQISKDLMPTVEPLLSANRQQPLIIQHKGKGHPATGRPSLQGRIVPTEARPSKLSETNTRDRGRECQAISVP